MHNGRSPKSISAQFGGLEDVQINLDPKLQFEASLKKDQVPSEWFYRFENEKHATTTDSRWKAQQHDVISRL